MNLIKNKKAISDVIATVLLILITIAVIGVIAGFVVPFVKNNLSQSTECVEFREYYKFDVSQGYSCYTDGLNGFSVRAKNIENSDQVKGFSVVFTKVGNSKKIDVFPGTVVSCDLFGIRYLQGQCTGQLSIPGPGEMNSYVLNAEENYESVEIYPVLNSGRTCDRSDKINIIQCASGVRL